MVDRYEVIVGNVGTVYDGPEKMRAKENFRNYKKYSQEGRGRAANEEVTMMLNGEIVDSFDPKNEDNE